MARTTHDDHSRTTHELAAVKAATLIESLPWLKRFHDQIIVIKFGGNAMVSHELQRAFAEDIVYLRYAGIRPVVVHGGGPQISAMLDRLGIESEFRGGYRVTTPEAMDVVRMVLTGQISRDIVEPHQRARPARRRPLGRGRRAVQGRAGAAPSSTASRSTSASSATSSQSTPRRSSRSSTPAASRSSPRSRPTSTTRASRSTSTPTPRPPRSPSPSGAAKLVILTDVAGLYRDWPDRDSLVSVIAADELRELLPSLESGMIPKMAACLDAVDGGVAKAAIIDGRDPALDPARGLHPERHRNGGGRHRMSQTATQSGSDPRHHQTRVDVAPNAVQA